MSQHFFVPHQYKYYLVLFGFLSVVINFLNNDVSTKGPSSAVPLGSKLPYFFKYSFPDFFTFPFSDKYFLFTVCGFNVCQAGYSPYTWLIGT